ncbi:MAG TPA: hypothetical protein PKI14_15215 [Fervidobacterium sp.]|jgi:lipid II:glycine glycyltransferase (peptidoglycan interpeptide bridge formation enzyme)|nr:hypothetical protein [Fervidobacterium sp.]HUM44292.1 hypothetical protein [Fervidobacterium sp.]
MLEIESRRYGFKTKTIWFSEAPFDVTGYDKIAFRACTKDVNIKGFSKQEVTTLIIDLTQDLDAIWRKMSKSSCRSAINKAKREGVQILINQEYEAFIDINEKFREAKELPAYNIDIDFMKNHGILFVSMFDGTILGGQFYLNDDKNMRWLLGASKRLEVADNMKSLVGAANRLMIWEAIQYAKNAGFSEFDMGGYYTGKKADPQKEGINIFKKSFGGDIVTRYRYEKDYSTIYTLAEKSYKLYNAIKNRSIRKTY